MKIAIAGFGAEGRSNYEYFKTRGDVTIVDEREQVEQLPEGVPAILGERAFEKLDGFDLVVRTAGLAPYKIKTSGKIWSTTNEFFEKCQVPIVGVTGSKGKGTTSSMIASILRASGHKTLLVGNIGQPALDVLEEANQADVVVYELSSFQLWDLEKSPQVAVVLAVEPDHLDVHKDFADYVNAKANIRKHQTATDICFYHPTNPSARRIAETNPLSNAYRYNDPSEDNSVYIDDEWFVASGCRQLSTDVVQLPGRHNLENACAAICASLEFTWDWEEIGKGLRDFTGLPHRLKFVDEISNVKFYDDSIATTPGSAIAAIRAFAQPKIIILGGSDKGADFTELVQAASENNVTHAVLIGAEALRLERAFEGSTTRTVTLGEPLDMTGIVQSAYQLAQPGDIVILSPACASFGMFQNYGDRGDQFIRAVKGLKEEHAATS